ncbi:MULTISPECIES: ammonium transporter [unclassified Iodidimonas]|jgi:Amt family ammonium transporter|uniref:ammonium transporter n=1 Tax=unclassified Iodidimonas TaxID=2626145 RepID=UPI0024821DC8|nr:MULTISPECIES: ammonium transporter [unclassified Iodidimonas]
MKRLFDQMKGQMRLLRACAATGLVVSALLAPAPAFAAVSEETAFVFNTLLFLIGGFLVMWMAAGFCMLEAGLVRSKNVADICLKNISLYSIAGIMYYLIGYRLMYDGVDGGFMGSIGFWSPDDSAALAETGDFSAGYAATSDWFFQMVFVATAASIVSGTMAERVKLVPFLIFTALLTGIIYPLQGAWHWGGGWLSEMGFADFAGSTLVHSVGGWAALTGAIILGARLGKYDAHGRPRAMPGSSLPLATLGTFVLWFGWFGFNGASQLALGSAADSIAISQIFANTNMAAAGGVVTALILTRIIYKKVDLTMSLNGALAGLVAITAEPLTPSIGQAIIIGSIGSALVVFAIPFIDRLKIDDVVGAISVHLVSGIWGTLAVPLTNGDASFLTQLIGVVAIGAFVIVLSTIFWLILKYTIGIRLHEEAETIGSDIAELGLEAYPEFGGGSHKYRGN